MVVFHQGIPLFYTLSQVIEGTWEKLVTYRVWGRSVSQEAWSHWDSGGRLTSAQWWSAPPSLEWLCSASGRSPGHCPSGTLAPCKTWNEHNDHVHNSHEWPCSASGRKVQVVVLVLQQSGVQNLTDTFLYLITYILLCCRQKSKSLYPHCVKPEGHSWSHASFSGSFSAAGKKVQVIVYEHCSKPDGHVWPHTSFPGSISAIGRSPSHSMMLKYSSTVKTTYKLIICMASLEQLFCFRYKPGALHRRFFAVNHTAQAFPVFGTEQTFFFFPPIYFRRK